MNAPRLSLPLLLCLLFTATVRAGDKLPAPEHVRFFETAIRPLLHEHCLKCHGPDKQRADLRLDSRAAILKGGANGPAVVLGEPDKSLLIRAVRHAEPAPKMPRDGKLTDRQIADLAKWVKLGLPYPGGTAVVNGEPERDFWAFKPAAEPPLPAVKDAGWVSSPLDRFILARLEAKGLNPAPSADARTLIRRATFDLTGLPPTPDEVDAFAAKPQAAAFEELIDRLLASPAYGERWGRHWLDVARYADSNGLDENVAYGTAWRYRDWVVAAINRDLPYDRFLVEQIAGDLLPGDDAGRNDRLIATGFLSLGPKVLAEVDERKMEMDIVDEQIDTLGRSVLGLTLGCARCHDHKFDPITAEDYYALAGIFKSTKTMEHFKKIAKWHENPLAAGKDAPTALGVTEAAAVNVPVHIRGNHLKLGKVVPRRVPSVLAGASPPTLDAKQSGRLQLAEWLVRPDHPLTARVMVNRLWRWHFGQGIVRTPDNFGKLGERPDDPALLDWLARRFVAEGWSIKAMHRVIMLSSTYRMSAAGEARGAVIDPDNRLHGRANVRRLEAEAVRDALLAVSGTLDRTPGGSLLHVKNREFLFDHTSKDLTKYDSRRRSLYLPVIRNNVYDVFQLFDFPDPAVPSGDRATTTVAPQALFMLNSPFVMQRCDEVAAALLADAKLDDAGRVRRLYLKAYGREPTGPEMNRALSLVRQVEEALREPEMTRSVQAWSCACQAVVAANEFIYVR